MEQSHAGNSSQLSIPPETTRDQRCEQRGEQRGEQSVELSFLFVWLMTNKCLVRPETSQSRAGWGVVGCVPLSPVTPVVAGVCVGWPEPPEKVSRVSVSQC